MTDCWAVVPAAGRGERFGGDLPKQYAPVAGRTVIEWAAAPFIEHPRVRGIVVALAPDDPHWPMCALADDPSVRTVAGGAERAASVRNALEALAGEADAADWVLVHDAARPCLPRRDLGELILAGESDDVGAILALRVADTLKRDDGAGRISETVAREGLWRALTPQMFRLGELRQALDANSGDPAATDEAMVMERTGRRARLVPGDPVNIKITHPSDLALAERLLRR